MPTYAFDIDHALAFFLLPLFLLGCPIASSLGHCVLNLLWPEKTDCGSGFLGWDVTLYVPTTGGFNDFPWNPSARRVVAQAFVPALNYRNNFANDFPGTPRDDFALEANGAIIVDSGSHQFCTTSDDGSWLYIDGDLLLNNEGMHAEKTVCQNIQLSSGRHTISVKFFEHEGNEILYVTMDGSELRFDSAGNAPVTQMHGRK